MQELDQIKKAFDTFISQAETFVEKQKVKEEYKRWRGKEGEEYFCIDDNGDIYDDNDFNNKEDNFRYNTGNYFQTEKEAEQYRDRLLATTKVNDRIDELNEDWKPDWNTYEQCKYLIVYSI